MHSLERYNDILEMRSVVIWRLHLSAGNVHGHSADELILTDQRWIFNLCEDFRNGNFFCEQPSTYLKINRWFGASTKPCKTQSPNMNVFLNCSRILDFCMKCCSLPNESKYFECDLLCWCVPFFEKLLHERATAVGLCCSYFVFHNSYEQQKK